MTEENLRRFGSAIVQVGNNSATTEKDVLNMATRIASSSKQFGLSQDQIIGFSAGLSSLGLEAEAGGTSFSKFITKMKFSIDTGDKALKIFADTAGLTTEKFKKLYSEDKSQAILKFISGLKKQAEAGENIDKVMQSLEISSVRELDMIKRMVSGYDSLTNAMGESKKGWEENKALTIESNKAYSGFYVELTKFQNRLAILGAKAGEKVAPTIKELTDLFTKFTDKLDDIDVTEFIKATTKITVFLFAMKGVSGTIGIIKNLIDGWTLMKLAIDKVILATNAMKVASLSNPYTVLFAVALASATAFFSYVMIQEAERKRKVEEYTEAEKNRIKQINEQDKARLENSKKNYEQEYQMFINKSDIYRKNKEEQDKIQTEINDIYLKATINKQKLNDKEIKNIEAKIKRLDELKNEELKIVQAGNDALIIKSRIKNQNFKGTFNEYKILKDNEFIVLDTAKEKELGILEEIKNKTIENVGLKYSESERLTSEAYKKEIENLDIHFNKKREKINEKYEQEKEAWKTKSSELFDVTQSGFEGLLFLNDKYVKVIEESSKKLIGFHGDRKHTAEKFNKKLKEHYLERLQNQETFNSKQIKNWLTEIAELESKGTKIEGRHKKLAEKIIKAYETAPKEVKDIMENLVKGIYNGLGDKEKEIVKKAGEVAGSITQKFRDVFKIQSPSVEMKNIFKFLLEGGIKGLESKEDDLYDFTSKIGEKVLLKFNELGDLIFPDISPKMITRTQTILTTPNLTIYTENLDRDSIDEIVDEVNKRFGGKF